MPRHCRSSDAKHLRDLTHAEFFVFHQRSDYTQTVFVGESFHLLENNFHGAPPRLFPPVNLASWSCKIYIFIFS